MFCKKCGKQIDDDSIFCPFCGEQVVASSTDMSSESKRKVVFEGEIHKCPNCGEIIQPLETKCSSCGFEFRNSQSSHAVEIFSKKLKEIESKRDSESKISAGSVISKIFRSRSMDTIDKEIVNLIRNFNVPNNKEDICEFLILACSNINEKVVSATQYNEAGANNDGEFTSLKAVNDAWIAKATQVYQKAKISFGNEKAFKAVETIYLNKIDSLNKAGKLKIKKYILIFLALIACFAFLIGLAFLATYLEKNK